MNVSCSFLYLYACEVDRVSRCSRCADVYGENGMEAMGRWAKSRVWEVAWEDMEAE